MTQQPAATTDKQPPEGKETSAVSEATERAIKLCQEGNAHLQAKRPDEAIACYRRAIAEAPEFVDAHFNLAVILRDAERDEEALQEFTEVAKLNKHAPKAYNNLALIHTRNRRFEEAERDFRTSIDHHFQYASAHFNFGMLLCRLGRLKEGFRECEWRWQTSEFTPIRCLQPRWTGQRFDGTLLVHTEQGIGDTIQFMRFLPEIRERCSKIILFCPANLHCLIDETKRVDDLRTPGNLKLGEFEFYLPLMSAPYALGTELDTIPNEVPYLFPEARSVPLGESHVKDAKLKVGISWGGSVTHTYDKHRSCKLSDLAPLLDVEGVAFYSLQKGPQTAELAQLSPAHAARVKDVDALQKDMADAAAIVQQLDLVITVDTAVLHLAAALGKPTWGLLAVNADWRWMEDRDDSPWYPTLRLFRQTQLDNWQELIGRVAQTLQAEVDSRG